MIDQQISESRQRGLTGEFEKTNSNEVTFPRRTEIRDPPVQTSEDVDRLINDAEVADLLSMSRSWVTKQRFLRNHGEPHTFDIDPVMIGTSPRYRAADVQAWIKSKE